MPRVAIGAAEWRSANRKLRANPDCNARPKQTPDMVPMKKLLPLAGSSLVMAGGLVFLVRDSMLGIPPFGALILLGGMLVFGSRLCAVMRNARKDLNLQFGGRE